MSLLSTLGSKYGTDKVSHGFCDIYDELLSSNRHNITSVMEIGVFFGSSLRMWKEYLPNAEIHGLDHFTGKQGNGSSFYGFMKYFDEQKDNPDPRIKLFKVDQSSISELNSFASKSEMKYDFILDDGSHLMRDQQLTFAILFPLVKPGGYFIIEDVHTSKEKGYDVTEDGSNSTLRMLEKYQSENVWDSKYMTEDQLKYCNSQTEKVEIRNHGYSMTSIITKKI